MPKFNIVLGPKMLWATPGSLGPLLLMRIKWRRKSCLVKTKLFGGL